MSATPRERPMLFSAPMIRALLDGRKTQTRRVVAPNAADRLGLDHVAYAARLAPHAIAGPIVIPGGACPYGEPGDRLWVRETWRSSLSDERTIHFAASLSEYDRKEKGPWRPSIFMPRWASRITLEIAEVRVQRLQAISEDDARTEGVRIPDAATAMQDTVDTRGMTPYRAAFACLWDSINGKRRRREYVPLGEPGYGMPRTVIDESARWEANPWVWAITFRRLP